MGNKLEIIAIRLSSAGSKDIGDNPIGAKFL
jgi:hypothetical protein